MNEPATAAAEPAPADMPFSLPASFQSSPIEVREDWVRAHVMIDGYMSRHSGDRAEWELVGCEIPFTGEIINPDTGANSRTFVMAGVFDKIARNKSTGELWLWEHKTAASISGSYLEQLWLNNQITLYSIYAEQKSKWNLDGQPMAGVMYDVLQKNKTEWKPGENLAEFESRKAGMKQPGRAKQQKPDDENTYGQRLLEAYADPEVIHYHREPILFGKEDLNEQRAEIWELTKAYLHARERMFWPKNTSQCFVYQRRCEMHQICASRGNTVVVETMYRLRQAHRELLAAGIVGPDGKIPGDPRIVVTNSFLSTFRNCQRLAKLRYIDQLEIIGQEIRALSFGKAIHAALQTWDETHEPAKVREKVNEEFMKPSLAQAYAAPAVTTPGGNDAATSAFFDLPEF